MKRRQKTQIQDKGCKNITNGPAGAGCNIMFANGYVGFVEAKWVGPEMEDRRLQQIPGTVRG